MTRSATDIMQDIVFSAVIDAVEALKSASKGLPNTLLRDVNAIHANATFADLPKELQATITASVRTAFNRLMREGYSVSQADARTPAASSASRVPDRRRPPPAPGARPPEGRRPPSRSGRPPRKPKPPRP
jgi:hypothetical protein